MSDRPNDDAVIVMAQPAFMGAYCVGLARYLHGRRSGLNSQTHVARTPYELIVIDGIGACAEVAVCLHLNALWPATVGKGYGEPDLDHNGVTYEIRSTMHNDGRLIVKPTDTAQVFALVVAYPPRFRIAGFCTAAFARQAAFRHADGSHWVPQNRLTLLPEGGLWPADIAPIPAGPDYPVRFTQ